MQFISVIKAEFSASLSHDASEIIMIADLLFQETF